MPVVPKGLGYRKVPSTPTNVITANTTGGTTLKKITVFNGHTSNVTFYASRVVNNVSFNLLEIVLAPKETLEWTDPLHLNNGDSLRCHASIDIVLTMDAWGLELS